jgi:hypothetical protein
MTHSDGGRREHDQSLCHRRLHSLLPLMERG